MNDQTPSEESMKKATVVADAWWTAQLNDQDQFAKLRDSIALALDSARAEERERCAKFVQRIADAQMEERLKDVGEPWMKEICVLAAKRLDAMAAAIRSEDTPAGGE